MVLETIEYLQKQIEELRKENKYLTDIIVQAREKSFKYRTESGEERVSVPYWFGQRKLTFKKDSVVE